MQLASVDSGKKKENMSNHNYVAPAARAPVADPKLFRPDWTGGVPRDPTLLWLDKNENTDPELAKLTARLLSEIDPSAIYSYPDKTVSLDFYRALPEDIRDFKPIPLDGQELKWIERKNLLAYNFAEADREILDFLSSCSEYSVR